MSHTVIGRKNKTDQEVLQIIPNLVSTVEEAVSSQEIAGNLDLGCSKLFVRLLIFLFCLICSDYHNNIYRKCKLVT